MRILELTNYSSGICGVWTRVFEEAKRLAKKHEILVCSSNIAKGTEKIVQREETRDGVKIVRFPARKLGGESFMKWDFEEEAERFRPDIIIAHGYRQYHTTKALKVKKELGCRVFLVTHGPFVEGDITRSFFSKLAVKFYDKIIGPRTIGKFDKILTIAKWEEPYLKRMGAKKTRIEYIPNGIPKEFFEKKEGKEKNKILFLGRISPIKDLESLIKAMALIKDDKVVLEIVGPAEEAYLNSLKSLVKKLSLEKKIRFTGPIYEIESKIKKIDSAKIFVLPSKREAMPQSLIEAKARERIVLASDNRGSKSLIENGEDGIIFKRGDSKELAEKLNFVLENDLRKMRKKARKNVKKFAWGKIINKIEVLFS